MYTLTNKKNVYYNPPGTLTMNYPAIRYTLYKIDTKYANNSSYVSRKCYMLTVIGKVPNDKIIDELLKLPMCSYNRPYISDNLNHDILYLYY